ncbi:alpha/beta hydrolase [Actinacidiphila sp. bgisy167]|uniref:alpha/beta hydrolase n=1 Tax=Actinacidiphila sp. bgisy167 TaxID=3413797 RepID=UPI003D75E07D
MRKSDLPTLLLVHGAWHRKETWGKLINELPGIDVRTVQLPSSAPVPPERLGGLYDDAEVVRAAVDAIGRPYVVAAHSYGAVPVTQGLPGAANLRRVVSICGWLLDVGESLLSVIGGKPTEWMPEQEGGWYDMTSPREIFYADLSEEDAAAAAATLGPTSVASITETVTQAVWRTGVPVTAIYAKDEVMAPFFKNLAERAGDTVLSLPGSHSPFLSRPAELAAILRNELEQAAKEA